MAIVGGTPHLDPPGLELEWRNRRIIADRMCWPAGAVETCEEIERKHPGWYPNWHAPNLYKGFEAPAGYYARRRGARDREPTSYGVDAAGLIAAIDAVFSRCPVCGTGYPVPADSDLPIHEKPGTGRRCDVHWSTRTIAAVRGCCADVPAGPVQYRFDEG